MKIYKADLHVHTVLSPCADLEMGPKNIIQQAVRKNIDILGITDHNSTRQLPVMKEIAEKNGIALFYGVEVNTEEEVHCLAFFESYVLSQDFQKFLENHYRGITNKPAKFGDQVVVDMQEMIVEEESELLIASVSASINKVKQRVHELNGIFIPAHIDRQGNGILAQLGFIPESLNPDALELSKNQKINEYLESHPELNKYTIIQNSDAHFPENIGDAYSLLKIEAPTISEFKMALKRTNGREVLNNG
jgi:hypothetical protein